MRGIYILGLCLLCLAGAGAQQKVTLALEQAPAEELFREIERLTTYRIYCNPADTDSLRLSVQCTDCEAAEVLRQALQETSLKVSAFGQALFIAKDGELITSLHAAYYRREEAVDSAVINLSGSMPANSRPGRRASSENIVYEIGAPAGKPVEKARISGLVNDFRTGEAIAGAALFVREPMTGTTTDASCFYSLELPPGRHELNIRGMGMKETRRQLLLHTGGQLDIELVEQVYSLGEVTVSSERTARVRNTTIGMERLAIKDIKNMPTAFGEVDVMKVVLSLPGVKSVG